MKASINRNPANRIVEWFGLAGTLKLTQFHPIYHEQEHLPLAQLAQSPIQPGHKYAK